MIVRAAAAAALGLSVFIAPVATAGETPSGKAQAPAADSARPRDATSNLPSDSGSQTTTPKGAVTGAGQPQGKGKQPDVGSAGGLEPRARAQGTGQERDQKKAKDKAKRKDKAKDKNKDRSKANAKGDAKKE
jgi:hypothetical protein